MRVTFAELKRSGIFRAAVLYIAVGWGAVEILATVLPALTAPPWVVRFIIFAVVIGFPVAMFLSWLFEVGPDGIRRTAPDSTLGRVTIVASLLMLVGATTGLFLLVESRTDTLREARESPAPSVELRDRSLAVLDLRTLGASDDADFLSEGLADEIAVAMGRIPGLSLAARESARALETAGLDPREIGRRIGGHAPARRQRADGAGGVPRGRQPAARAACGKPGAAIPARAARPCIRAQRRRLTRSWRACAYSRAGQP